MKKRYLALTLAGLILGYIAKIDHWFEDERDVYFPITAEQLRQSAKLKQQEKQNQLSETLNVTELIEKKLLADTNKQAHYYSLIKFRLQNKNQSELSNLKYEREVDHRLNLLQAMSHYWPNNQSLIQISEKDLKSLLLWVAKNKDENILVRRQAYRHWLTFDSANITTKKEILAENSRRLNLISHSDASLMQSLTED